MSQVSVSVSCKTSPTVSDTVRRAISGSGSARDGLTGAVGRTSTSYVSRSADLPRLRSKIGGKLNLPVRKLRIELTIVPIAIGGVDRKRNVQESSMTSATGFAEIVPHLRRYGGCCSRTFERPTREAPS